MKADTDWQLLGVGDSVPAPGTWGQGAGATYRAELSTIMIMI